MLDKWHGFSSSLDLILDTRYLIIPLKFGVKKNSQHIDARTEPDIITTSLDDYCRAVKPMKQHLDLCIIDLFEIHNMLHYKKMMMEWDGLGWRWCQST